MCGQGPRCPPSRAARIDVDQRATVVGRVPSGFGRLSHDGEDRALDGREHRGVGTGGRRFERRCDDGAGRLVGRLQRRGDASQDLRHDDPTVATSPHQGAVADRVAGRSELDRGLVHLGDDRVEGARHVRPGVAIGDRVDVEPVDPRRVRGHDVAKRAHRVAQGIDTEQLECWHGVHCRATARSERVPAERRSVRSAIGSR